MISLRITGIKELERKFKGSKNVLDREMRKALGKSVAMAEGESKRRTPVDTGFLRSSIGGARGWKWVRGWVASVGTNLEYALFVHEGHGRHTVGERKFLEKGLKASVSFIEKTMKRATDNLARSFK